MKILVTGANGYLGQGIVKRLLDNGHEVIAASRSMMYVDKRAVQVAGNIFDFDDPYNAYGHPDIMLHLAWRNGFVHNDRSHLEDLPKHYAFIEKMVNSGLPHLAVMGSMHEIGFYEGCIKADTPANPQSLYGIAKNSLREAVQVLVEKSKLPLQWIRGYYIVGNTEHGCSIFSKITQAEQKGQKTFPFTSGLNQWDFLDYDEFCKQVAMVVEQQEYTGVINVCHGRPEKLSERVERFIAENHYKIKLAYGTFPDRPYDSKAVWGDDTVIRKITEKRDEAIC